MKLVDELMPQHVVREVDQVAVAADPARAYEALHSLEATRTPLVRGLFALRLLPDRFVAALRREANRSPAGLRGTEPVAPGSGFSVLGEDRGREIVIGAVGRFWRLRVRPAIVTPDRFAAFQEPGLGKLVWSLQVEPRPSGGSWIRLEMRATATDPVSSARFRRYLRRTGRASRMARRLMLRSLQRALGRARDEGAVSNGRSPRSWTPRLGD